MQLVPPRWEWRMLQFLHGRRVSLTRICVGNSPRQGAICMGIWSTPPRGANLLNARSLRLLSQLLGHTVKGYCGHAMGAYAGEGGRQDGRKGSLSGERVPGPGRRGWFGENVGARCLPFPPSPGSFFRRPREAGSMQAGHQNRLPSYGWLSMRGTSS